MLVGVCIRPDSPHAETGAQHTIITIAEAAENPYDDEEEAFPATATPQGSLLTLEQMMHLCAELQHTHPPNPTRESHQPTGTAVKARRNTPKVAILQR